LKLKKSESVDFFRHKDEIYLYHNLIGYILGMDKKVMDFLNAFVESTDPDGVMEEFAGRFSGEEMNRFITIFMDHRCLVREEEDEMEALLGYYPCRGPWVLLYDPEPENTTIGYKNRRTDAIVFEDLNLLEARIWELSEGSRSLMGILERLGDEFMAEDLKERLERIVFRWTHSDRQVMKLSRSPLYEYGRTLPPYLTSTMPFARYGEERERKGEEPDRIDLTRYHREDITDAREQFEVKETTLSHMFRYPHPALDGGTYGGRFAARLIEAGLIRKGCRILEVGGGTGYFSHRFLEEIWERNPGLLKSLRYAIMDLSPALQAAQRKLNEPFAPVISYFQGDALKLPFRDGTFHIVISNEVIADLETVKIARRDLFPGEGQEGEKAESEEGRREAGADREKANEKTETGKSEGAVGRGEQGEAPRNEGIAYIDRYGLRCHDAPEEFYLNLGAIKFLDEIRRVLTPGGTAFLIEYGDLYRYPVESSHLDHGEFSIHFGHLIQAANAMGLQGRFSDILQFLGFLRDMPVLATNQSYFEILRAFLARRDVRLEKIAYTRDMFKDLISGKFDFFSLHPLDFVPLGERVLALRPQEFKVLKIVKPAPAPEKKESVAPKKRRKERARKTKSSKGKSKPSKARKRKS
jgi:SAM-dependent methyltransferase